MKKKTKSDLIASKLTLTFIIVIIVQSIMLTLAYVDGGIFTKSKANAYQILAEKVKNRKDNLENQMHNVWQGFDHYSNKIIQYFDEAILGRTLQEKTADQILEDISTDLLEALYYTKTTGVFFILNSQEPDYSSMPALYIRNVSPNVIDEKTTNTYLVAGSWGVAEKLELVTGPDWNYRLKLDESNREFYDKTMSNWNLSDQVKYLGYWSDPFKITPFGDDIITYSVPLTGKNGKILGVFGVEISVDYLYKYLPVADMKDKNGYGYLIGIKNGDGAIEAKIMNGALQKQLMEQGMPLELIQVDETNSIYQLMNGTTNKEVYACVSQMGMYYENTPYSEEEWYLIGLVDKSELLQFSTKMKRILVSSLAFSLVTGCILSFFISKWFTKFARLIELSGLSVGVFRIMNKKNRVYMTVQVPQLLNLTVEQERQFTKNKAAFLQFMDNVYSNKTNEYCVYRILIYDVERWLRIKQKEREGAIEGIIEDVTNEIFEKHLIIEKSNYDPLTGSQNRKAFDAVVERIKASKVSSEVMVFMCDLNELKKVNDNLGHFYGDTYITDSSRILCETFGKKSVYRIGGDEFAILLENRSQYSAMDYMANLEQKVEAYNRTSNFYAAISAGYALYKKENDKTLEEVLQEADQMMYVQKEKMKSRLTDHEL